MKIRTVLVAILGIVFMSGMAPAQESASPEPASGGPLVVESTSSEPQQKEPTSVGSTSTASRRGRTVQVSGSSSGVRGRAVSRARSSSGEMVTQIFLLKYYPAAELGILIENIFSIDGEKIHADRSANQLILQATKEQMADIEDLIRELDVAATKLESNQMLENLVYRVFMFEIPSKNQEMKSFSMIIRMPSDKPSSTVLENAAEVEIQISDFQIIDEKNDEVDILIQGKAPSKKSIDHISAGISNYQIRELRWDDDETFTRNIEAAHYSRLPAQMQKHIQKFLGEDIITVGYWFGSSSVPGEVEAPIGPWKLRLELRPESDCTLELRVEVEAPEERSDFDRQLGREQSDEILSNTIQAKIGKPIIIGYNRQSYGTRKMGAMVILPEVDTIEAKEN